METLQSEVLKNAVFAKVQVNDDQKPAKCLKVFASHHQHLSYPSNNSAIIKICKYDY